MENQRESFIFYRSFFEAIEDLPDKNKLEIYKAIGEYSLDFKESKLTGISKTIFTLIKPQLDANNKRYANGCKPKTKLKESKEEAKPKQDASKIEANVNDNVNPNENVNDISIINNTEVNFGKDDINKMQDVIKKTIESNNMIYKAGKYERARIKNIVDGKDFGEMCDNLGMTRENFVINIINLATKLKYSKPINNGSDLYYNYAAVYNKALQAKNDILTIKREIG